MLEQQATQIPTDVPVNLLRIYVSKGGNLFMPGLYHPGELPAKAYNTYYVSPVVTVVKEEKTQVTGDASIRNGSFAVEPIKRDQSTQTVTENISINQKTRVGDKHIKPQIHKPVKAPALKINQANEEELVALNGVGRKTAERIIEYREASAFIDYQDLEARIPLPLGREWTSFDISFD